jgi:cellulose synthase operon protein C
MKKVLFVLLVIFLPASLAQEVKRLVVLPFSTSENARPYAAGLPVALQRALNTIDNVYVPPIGDGFTVAERLGEGLNPEALASAFDASAVISGHVEAGAEQAQVLIGLSGPSFAEAEDIRVTGPLMETPLLVERVLAAVIDALELSVSDEDRRELDSVVAQTPSFASLRAVAEASTRLRAPDSAQLEAAAQIDGESSWVMAEGARALALEGDLNRARNLSTRAVSAAPFDVEAWVDHGIITLAAGDQEGARSAFERALRLNPGHALALAGRGQLTQDEAEAEAALRAALESYPRLVDAYLQLARRQDPRTGLETLRAGASRVPESLALHEAVISETLRLDSERAALEYLRGLLTAQPDSPPTIYALAARLPSDAQAAGALELIRQGRERYPGSVTLALAESAVHERQGDLAAAEAALREGLESQPDDLTLANQLAIVQARQGRLGEAQATLESIAGEALAAQVNLAQVYLQAGQSGEAMSLLEPLLQDQPEDAQLWTLYGIALGRSGRYGEALEALDQSLALDPENEEVRRARAIFEQTSGVTGGEEITLTPEASAPFEAGLAALQAGDLSLAASEFSRARDAEDAAIIAFYEAYALQLSGRPRQAIGAYERALEEYSENSTIKNNLGYAYLQVGRFDRALSLIGEAIELNENNARAHLNLGLTYYRLGRYGEALSAWERAVALEPMLEDDLGELLESARDQAN